MGPSTSVPDTMKERRVRAKHTIAGTPAAFRETFGALDAAATQVALLRMNWLPESRITPQAMRLLRERLRYRITLVSMREALKCRIRA